MNNLFFKKYDINFGFQAMKNTRERAEFADRLAGKKTRRQTLPDKCYKNYLTLANMDPSGVNLPVNRGPP